VLALSIRTVARAATRTIFDAASGPSVSTMRASSNLASSDANSARSASTSRRSTQSSSSGFTNRSSKMGKSVARGARATASSAAQAARRASLPINFVNARSRSFQFAPPITAAAAARACESLDFSATFTIGPRSPG
jgi:hypothetical protein